VVKNNLILTEASIEQPVRVSMPEADARQWFGKAPPDLSLTARERGTAWIYRYLTSFYPDPKRPFGVNNAAFPDVGMPNALAPLCAGGKLTDEQFKTTVSELVAFMAYVAEPVQATRKAIGLWVLPFLGLCLLVVLLLWKSSKHN
jgi:ubiquinol-cytochrome c reductase cytochrome c1 subunit